MSKKKIQKVQNEEIDKIGVLGDFTTDPETEDDDDESISKIQREKETAPKPKRKITDKQLEALQGGQRKRLEMARMKRELEKQKQEEEKRRQEELIIKKALALKKKQIKKEAILHEISDDETPIEVIKKIAKKTTTKKTELPPIATPQKPQFIFV